MCGTTDRARDTVAGAWDDTVGKNSWIGGGQAGRDIDQVGRNISDNFNKTAAGVGLILQGDWSNADRTLMDLVMTGGTGINPISSQDMENITGKQTQVDRKISEATAQEAADNAAAVQAEQDALNKQISDMLQGVTTRQRQAPGRALTLLGPSSSGSLLTPR